MKTSSSAKNGPTKTCKQIYDLAKKRAKKSASKARGEGYVGGMALLEKRTGKDALGCDIRIKALAYPDRDSMVYCAL
jgi:hypothetical protein